MSLVQLDFSDQAYKDLKVLSANTSIGETVSNALALYRWFVEITDRGDEILVLDKDGLVNNVTIKLPERT